MLVVGGVLFISWCIWDVYFAEYPFVPRRVFNRTFVSTFVSWATLTQQIACVTIDFFYYSSSYLIDTYFTSWVYVIVDWNVSGQ